MDIREYEALSSGQNAFLTFADMGLDKLVAQINADYDRDMPQGDTEHVFAVQIYSSAVCQGKYVNCSRTLHEFSDLGTEDAYKDYLSLYEHCVYRQGGNEPLKISDLFVPGSDWKALLKDAMLRRLGREDQSGDIDIADPAIAEFYDLMIERIDETCGFTVNSNSIVFDFDYGEMDALAEDLFFYTSLRDSRYYIADFFETVFFSDIGYENLEIFK